MAYTIKRNELDGGYLFVRMSPIKRHSIFPTYERGLGRLYNKAKEATTHQRNC